MTTAFDGQPWLQQPFNVSQVNADLGAWTVDTPYPLAVNAPIIFVTKNYVYAIGGHDGTNIHNEVYRAPINVDGSIGAWAAQTAFPVTIVGGQAILINGYIYVIGGTQNGSNSTAVWVAPVNADGTIGSWTSTYAMSQIRAAFAAWVTSTRLYVAGGNTTGFGTTASVEYATINGDGTINAWASDTAMPTARYGWGVYRTGTQIHLMGGVDGGQGLHGDGYYATINPDGTMGAWTAGSGYPVVLDQPQFASSANVAVAMGGVTTGWGVTAATYHAPITGDTIGTFAAGTNLAVSTYSASGFITSSRIYIVGGLNSARINTVQYATWSGGYNDYTAAGPHPIVAAPWKNQGGINTNNASDVTWYNGTLSGATQRINNTAFVTKNYAFIAGGQIGGSAELSVQSAPINTDGTLGAWTTLSNLPAGSEARIFRPLLTQSRIYLLGGILDGVSGVNLYAPINADGTIGSWVVDTNSMPAACCRGGVAVCWPYAYWFGGFNNAAGSAVLNYVFRARIDENGVIGPWSAVTGLPSALGDFATVETNSRIYILGGGTNGAGNASSGYYADKNADGTIGAWTSCAIPAGRSSPGSFCTDTHAFFFGGLDSAYNLTGNGYSAPIDGFGVIGTWSAISSLPEGLFIGEPIFLTTSRICVPSWDNNLSAATPQYTESAFSGGRNDYTIAGSTPSNVTGDINQTLSALTQSLVANNPPAGIIAQTLSALTQTATAQVTLNANINQVLTKLKQAATAFDAPTGIINQTLQPLGKQSATTAITGPFFFAWCNEADAWGPSFHVMDEDVFEYDFNQVEGDFATLEIVIRNPKIGLLAVGRKLWCWFGVAINGVATPIFHGRLVGVPNNIFAELVTLQFIARPTTYTADKSALADTLKVAPFWDDAWIQPDMRNDPDTVLEARSQVWHIDPVTLAVTVTDVLVGEDGTENFTESEVPYDSVAVTIGSAPLGLVHIDATATWTQSAQGSVNLLQGAPGSLRNGSFGTFSYDTIMNGWPKVGSNLADGWTVTQAKCDLLDDLKTWTTSYNSQGQKVTGLNASLQIVPSLSGSDEHMVIPDGSAYYDIPIEYKFTETFGWEGKPGHFSSSQSSVEIVVPFGHLSMSLVARYSTSRNCTEKISIDVVANLQSVVVDAAGDDVKSISLQSVNLSEPINGVIPIGDVRNRSYITSDRGTQSLEFFLAIARANLLIHSRVVDVDFEVPFSRIVNMSLRKNATMTDSRLPGGGATGKIKKLRMKLNGDDGKVFNLVTIGCAVGETAALTTIPGTGVYALPGYMQSGYQRTTGEQVIANFGTTVGEIGYVKPDFAPNDDGINFYNGLNWWDALDGPWQVLNNSPTMPDAVGATHQALADKIVKEVGDITPASIQFKLKPLGGSFETDYVIATTTLQIPKMIDLGA